ncbi:MAG: hypothetical protein PF569_01050 [Candidatus Woesearchaeota archaeon]|jgi:hypothetical protein|nr:hypothetical protein [Candidatus Woesearchaeota archaeon]
MNKKAIGPVIASSLLIVVVVVALVGFQNWFQSYSSEVFNDVEIRSNSGSVNDLKIETLLGNSLYVSNNLESNLSIDKLTIQGIECLGNTNLIFGMNDLNVSDCLSNITVSKLNVILFTN